MCTILIVDDSPAVRTSLRSYIEQNTDWAICGEAENGAVAIDSVERLRPSVVILDLSMPVMNGLEAARRIREMSDRIHILLFTMHAHPQLSDEARRLGVNAVVSKTSHPSELLNAVRSLLES